MKSYTLESHCRGIHNASTSYHLVEEDSGTHVSVSSTLEGIYDFCMNHKPRIIIDKIHLLLNAVDKASWSMIPKMKQTKARVNRSHAMGSRIYYW